MKKGLSSIIAATLLFGIIGNVSAIDNRSNVKRFILHCPDSMFESGFDVNCDGRIDMFDMIRYKKNILYTEPIITSTELITTAEATTTMKATTTAPPVTTTEVTTNTVATPAPVITEPPATAPPSVSHRIYITKTGKKYHYDNTCNGGTYFEVSLEDALAKGLTPCSKCVHD